MQRTIDETNRRREKQIEHNTANNIIPTTIKKSHEQIFAQGSVLDVRGYDPANPYSIAPDENIVPAAEEQEEYMTIPGIQKKIAMVKKSMTKASKDLDFMEAARLRDEMFRLEKKLAEMKAG
ncbi:MAG: UvrB/UvrC motif-containing protein [Ferruginibacter sp.]